MSYECIPVSVEASYYPMSSAQQRLYFLYAYNKESLSYNMPQIVKLRGELDIERLEQAFISLIDRHSILRTRFKLEGGAPVQIIEDEAQFILSVESTNASLVDAGISSFIRPFNLEEGPVIRGGLLRLGEEEHILMVDMHHIVSDGVSSGIMVRDFMSFYEGSVLSPLRLSYKDYAVWQQSDAQQERQQSHQQYWHDVYSEEPVVLDLPYDHPRSSIAHHPGGSYAFELVEDQVSSLKDIAITSGTTIFSVLFSAYSILLSRLSNEEDIIVGTPVAGREHADLEGMIGMFVNTLALRTYPKGDERYIDYLRSVSDHLLSGFEHQSYPYESLIDDLNLSRDTNRNPLFDTMFSYGNFEDIALEMSGLELEGYDSGLGTVKFDLTLNASEQNGKLYFSLSYSTGLFNPPTIARFASYFETILDQIINQPDLYLKDIDILSAEEKEELLFSFNDTTKDYPKDYSLIDLFSKQVKEAPIILLSFIIKRHSAMQN